MLVWSAVVDMLPYKLLDALLLQSGQIELRFDTRSGNRFMDVSSKII